VPTSLPPSDFPSATSSSRSAQRGSLGSLRRTGSDRLTLKLEPLESISAYVVVETAGAVGAAVLQLTDQRGGKRQGGVMLVCIAGLDADPAGSLVEPEHPCPAALARDPYPMTANDPSKAPARTAIRVAPLRLWCFQSSIGARITLSRPGHI
jgi:hypothetical protein